MTTTISADNGSISGSAGLKSTPDGSGVLALQTGANVTALTIDASQNVGIGTSSPQNFGAGFKTLQITSSGSGASGGPVLSLTDSASTEVRLQAYNGTAALYAVGATIPIVFSTASAERMRIDSSGNVGIGTSSPATKLNVIGDIQLSRSTTASDAAFNFGSNSNNYIYSGNFTNIMAFATSGTERMRIDASGN